MLKRTLPPRRLAAGAVLLAVALLAAQMTVMTVTASNTPGPSTPLREANQGYPSSTATIPTGLPPVIATQTIPLAGGQVLTAGIINNTTGGQFTAPSGSTAPAVTIYTPPGSLPDGVRGVSVNPNATLPANAPTPPAPTGGTAVIKKVFELSTFDGQNLGSTLTKPVTISFPVDAQTLADAAGKTITLQFFNTTTGAWQQVAANVVNGVLIATLDHFSLWALVIVDTPATPTTTVPRPPSSGTSVGASHTTTAVGLVVFGALVAASAVGWAGMARRRA